MTQRRKKKKEKGKKKEEQRSSMKTYSSAMPKMVAFIFSQLIYDKSAAGAGLTGSKVARRIGEVDEFELKAIGENHNQGLLAIEISVLGFVFEEEDFIRPWEEQHDNLERISLLRRLIKEVKKADV